MITIHIEPAPQRFGRVRKRRQWRWLIDAGNGRLLDPRDTYANPGDIESAMRRLFDPAVPVRIFYAETGATKYIRGWELLEDVPREITRVSSMSGRPTTATEGPDGRWRDAAGNVLPLDAYGPWAPTDA